MGRSFGRVKALKGFSAPLRSRSRALVRGRRKGKQKRDAATAAEAVAVAATTTERGCAAETGTTGATDTQRDEYSRRSRTIRIDRLAA